MAKLITIVASNKMGEEATKDVLYPESLEEAIKMFGEKTVFVGFLKTKMIEDQRDVRPTKEAIKNGTGRRMSVLDRLQNS